MDWTHEREWRVPGNVEFNNYSGIHIILYNPECFKHFLNSCPPDILKKISGVTTLTTILM